MNAAVYLGKSNEAVGECLEEGEKLEEDCNGIQTSAKKRPSGSYGEHRDRTAAVVRSLRLLSPYALVRTASLETGFSLVIFLCPPRKPLKLCLTRPYLPLILVQGMPSPITLIGSVFFGDARAMAGSSHNHALVSSNLSLCSGRAFSAAEGIMLWHPSSQGIGQLLLLLPPRTKTSWVPRKMQRGLHTSRTRAVRHFMIHKQFTA